MAAGRACLGALQVRGQQRAGVGADDDLLRAPPIEQASVAARVASPTRTEPGRAADCNAPAKQTVSPMGAVGPVGLPIGPTTAQPVSTPTRTIGPPSIGLAGMTMRKAASRARAGSSS